MSDHSAGVDEGRAQSESVATEPPRTPPLPEDPATHSPDGVFRTPISNKASSTILPALRHSVTEQARKDHQYNQKATEEMDEVTVEVKYETFMRLAQRESTKSLTDKHLEEIGDFKALQTVNRETEMYPIFCDRLNKAMKLAKPKAAVVKDTAEWRESPTVDQRPDIGIYPTHKKARRACKRPKSNVQSSRQPHIARVAWAWLECFGELKYDANRSAYEFLAKKGLLHLSELGSEARAQVTAFATELMYRQHRTHLFTFYVWRSHARLMRWDRSGLIISTPINLLEKPQDFLNFFYQMATMTREQLGYDTTATLASDAEAQLFRELPLSNEHAKTMRTHAVSKPEEYPIYKIQCQTFPLDENGEVKLSAELADMETKDYLVGKPLTYPCSLTGRATKGYVALDLDRKRLVFLKDAWRAKSKDIHPELDTYIILNSKSVRNVPTVLGGGDVGGTSPQHTLTQKYLSGPTKPLDRSHCRLILKELGRPLDSYVNSAELILVVAGAFEGHCDAWEKAKILHRDVSMGNILIDIEGDARRPRGLLADWDLCKYQTEMSSGPSQPGGRSGTWPYLSALALQYPKKPIELADDQESFVYILTYCALRFHAHNKGVAYYPDDKVVVSKEILEAHNVPYNKLLARFISNVFYEEALLDGHLVGGFHKLAIIAAGHPGFDLREGANGPVPLARLLRNLYALLHQHYAAIDVRRLDQYKAQPPLANVPNDDELTPTEAFDVDFLTPNTRLTNLTEPLDDDNEGIVGPKPLAQWSGRKPPRRILDDHRAMGEALWKIWNGPKGRIAALRDSSNDKTQDQFYGIVSIKYNRPIGPSGTSTTKRKFDADDASTSTSTTQAKYPRLEPSSAEALESVEEAKEGHTGLEAGDESESDLTELTDSE